MREKERRKNRDGSHVLYTYDAGGVKLRTDYYINPLASSVPQVAGATGSAGTTLKHTWTDYCGNFIYENDSLKQTLVAGGYVSYLYSQGATTPTPQYHFYVQDHLGDNRVVADEKGNIEQINHYYPFGGLMGESRNLASNQKYKYNGKELDRMHGLDWYDYGARMYDAALGLWHSMDPLAEKYYGVSPYVYCGDNPINAFDPDGRTVYEGNKIAIYIHNKELHVSSKANHYTKALFAGMMKTKTGRSILTQMVKSPTKIHLVYSSKSTRKTTTKITGKSIKTETEITYAETKPTTKDGSSIVLKDGKFSSTWAQTTFYVNEIEESTKEKGNDNYGYTMEEALGAEGTHEGVHSSDPKEVDTDIRHSQPHQKRRTKDEYERKAREKEQQYRDELK